MCRYRQLQFSFDLLGRDELLLDCCSDDVDISILICLPLTSRSTLVFHRAMLLIMVDPVTNSLETARNLARYLGSLLSIFVESNDSPSLLSRQRSEGGVITIEQRLKRRAIRGRRGSRGRGGTKTLIITCPAEVMAFSFLHSSKLTAPSTALLHT
jgi:hypothetical protein